MVMIKSYFLKNIKHINVYFGMNYFYEINAVITFHLTSRHSSAYTIGYNCTQTCIRPCFGHLLVL